jgi:S1-C subfamily serine protease
VTTAHTVWGARSLKLATPLGILHGRIVAARRATSLALIEAYPRIPGLVAPAPAPSSAASAGQLVRTVGRRGSDPDAGAYGFVSIPARAIGRGTGGSPLPSRTTALDTPLVPEVSGGAVLDEAGRLVGMAISQEGRPGLSLPWRAISGRLNELRPGPREVYVGWRDQYRCVSAQHAYARAHHPGFRARDARLDAYVPATRLPGTEALDG